MDLLQEEYGKKKRSKEQKIVLFLLIVSIVLTIIVITLLYLTTSTSLFTSNYFVLNGKTIKDNFNYIEQEDGSIYISIQELCKQFEYKFYKGEFNVPGESLDKCFVQKDKNIVQFFANSKKIYKTQENSVKDYEYYMLKNDIIQKEGTLFINAEDLNIGLNLIYSYSKESKQTTIMSPEYWIEKNKESLEQSGYTITEDTENIKAIAYGCIIVENNSRYGILDYAKKEIIGLKYNNISFIEYTGQFIVSNIDGKFGIIDINGSTIIDLQYDSIEVLNYNPLLYQVERQKKFGIIREDGTIIDEIRYSSIGYPKDINRNVYYTLIIPELNENIKESIVVCIDKQYGLITLEEGKVFLPCEFKGIFKAVDRDSKVFYAIQFEDNSINTLENYINSLNQITVNINN